MKKSIKDSLYGVTINKVIGDCRVSQLNLTSLEGAPISVSKSFLCSNNKLKSLQYAPQYIGLHFMCAKNLLTTLEGLPNEIGGTLGCNDNMLKSLKGVPQSIGGSFDCSSNKLETLQYLPKKVGRYMKIEDNNPLYEKYKNLPTTPDKDVATLVGEMILKKVSIGQNIMTYPLKTVKNRD